MYYEEEVIGGILCWRSMPDGKFIPCTKQKLTALLLEARERIRILARDEGKPRT